MKNLLNLICCSIVFTTATAQTAITSVVTSSGAASGSTTYSNAGITYNWGLAPNNTNVFVDGFTAGGIGYSYASFLTGAVKLRRVNNALITGNFSLAWAETVTAGSVYNMLPEYQNDMELFFNNRSYNKGTDNFFDNTSTNCNNIERLDWVMASSYATSFPADVGFAVFERGGTGAHDPFCIAAITAVDGLGNPTAYGNIVRVVAANYGDPGPSVSYRILKAQYPSNLFDGGSGSQNRGGVIVSLQNMGISAGQPIFGYSLFSNDLPVGATSADLIDVTNATYFPITTGNPGGIDLVAVTGIYISNTVLPVTFTSFSAVENNDAVTLNWQVENETAVDSYEAERSTDGRGFLPVAKIKSSGISATAKWYGCTDNTVPTGTNTIYYRIKQYDRNGNYSFSKIITVKRNANNQQPVIYPNPVKQNLFVSITAAAGETVDVSIFNEAGQKVMVQQYKLLSGNNTIAVNGTDLLPAGMYHATIQKQNGKTITQPFLKQ